MIGELLWRVWKWLLHLMTGRCEVFRLALWSAPVHLKTLSIKRSLLDSRSKTLSKVVTVKESTEALSVIVSVKKVPSDQRQQFKDSLRPCLTRICCVSTLLSQVEELRTQKFSKENPQHEKILLELWSMLYPNVELENRITKQWQDIGFQGNDPVTDFRGMGMLGLTCLHYFSCNHGDVARSVLSHSNHPRYDYPYAIVVINLTSLGYDWLKEGQLDCYLYKQSQPLTETIFYEIVGSLVVRFDAYWIKSEPENVMAFPRVREAFANELTAQLNDDTLSFTVSKN